MKRIHLLAGSGAAVALLVGCAAVSPHDDLDAPLQSMLKASFRSQGIATVDRLDQDPGQRACSTGHPLAADAAQRIQAEAQATIRAPSDGHYLGDWRQGEKLAQNGRGMTWTDKSALPSANGANCYNCHQITKAEISFGTIGPSLYHYARLRGVSNPTIRPHCRCCSTRGARCSTPGPRTPARTCRASATRACSTSSR